LRRISFALTTDAVIERRKDVTRRLGWSFAKPGMKLLAVDKLRTKDARHLAVIEIVSVRSEPLNWLTADDLVREGFARDHFFGAYGNDYPISGYGIDGFVNWFAATAKWPVTGEVNRIEFCYLDCYVCGARPTCVGTADVSKDLQPMCDAHCGHSDEDGCCWPLAVPA